MLNKLKPKKQVLHDVLDFYSCNPHEKKDTFIKKQKILQGKHLVEKEVEEALDMIELIKDRVGAKTYVVVSNHDVFLDRYINDENWKHDLHNSEAFLRYALIQQTVDLTEYGCIFGYLVNKRFDIKEVEYLNFGQSLDICGYQCGIHGDFGSNGSKGSVKQFSNLNTKLIHGHGHSPTIFNGVTMVGVTANLHQYYNRRGLSSWAYAHSVIHPTCKNQLIVFGDDNLISSLI